MDEFSLIRHFFRREVPNWRVAIGDDAAIFRPDPGEEIVVCSDTLVAGRHFPAQAHPSDIGWKALAVNLSDLAAMGAQPRGFLLNLTLPAVDETFLAELSRGLFELADHCKCPLVGGDTTRGPLALSITAIGCLPTGSGLMRGGARVGDALIVVGTLGGAALALEHLDDVALLAPLSRPQPQLQAGLVLRDLAHAAIDISDGLSADLGHVLAASNCGATIDASALPLCDSLATQNPADRLQLALSGGDDYALCVSLPAQRLADGLPPLGACWSRIGTIEADPGLRLRGYDGRVHDLQPQGWQHFR